MPTEVLAKRQLLLPSAFANNEIATPEQCDKFWMQMAKLHPDFVRFNPIQDENGKVLTTEGGRTLRIVSVGPVTATRNALVVGAAHDNEPAGLNAELVMGERLLSDSGRSSLANTNTAIHFFIAAPDGRSMNRWMNNADYSIEDLIFDGFRPHPYDQAVWGLDFKRGSYEHSAKSPEAKACMAAIKSIKPDVLIENHGAQLARGMYWNWGKPVPELVEPLHAIARTHQVSIDGLGEPLPHTTEGKASGFFSKGRSSAIYDLAIQNGEAIDFGGTVSDFVESNSDLKHALIFSIEVPMFEIRKVRPSRHEGQTAKEIMRIGAARQVAVFREFEKIIRQAIEGVDSKRTRSVQHHINFANKPIQKKQNVTESITALYEQAFYMDTYAGAAARIVDSKQPKSAQQMRDILRTRLAEMLNVLTIAKWPFELQVDCMAASAMIILEKTLNLSLLPDAAKSRLEGTQASKSVELASVTPDSRKSERDAVDLDFQLLLQSPSINLTD